MINCKEREKNQSLFIEDLIQIDSNKESRFNKCVF